MHTKRHEWEGSAAVGAGVGVLSGVSLSSGSPVIPTQRLRFIRVSSGAFVVESGCCI
jgi:hypothetical protein